jgi:hypothetical protein
MQKKPITVLIISDLSKQLMRSYGRVPGLIRHLHSNGFKPITITEKLQIEPGPEYGQIVQTRRLSTIVPLARLFRRQAADPSGGGSRLAPKASSRDLIIDAVRRQAGLILKSVLWFPDDHRKWRQDAIKLGMDLLTSSKVQIIFSSSFPVSAHVIASALKRRHPEVCWVADYRDLWSQNYGYPYGGLRRLFDRLYEKAVMKRADLITTVSEPIAARLRMLLRGVEIHPIRTGFDERTLDYQDELDQGDLFTLTFTGQIYDHSKQRVELLLQAVRRLIDNGAIPPERVRIKFFGPPDRQLAQKVIDAGMREVVMMPGTVSRDQSLIEQRRAQVLLFFNWEDRGQRGTYSGKIFEYLAARRPVLVVGGQDGVLTRLIAETGSGHVCSNQGEIEEWLATCYGEFEKHGRVKYRGNAQAVRGVSHEKMAKEFASVFGACLRNCVSGERFDETAARE